METNETRKGKYNNFKRKKIPKMINQIKSKK
jgi:hypothetical protein